MHAGGFFFLTFCVLELFLPGGGGGYQNPNPAVKDPLNIGSRDPLEDPLIRSVEDICRSVGIKWQILGNFLGKNG